MVSEPLKVPRALCLFKLKSWKNGENWLPWPSKASGKNLKRSRRCSIGLFYVNFWPHTQEVSSLATIFESPPENGHTIVITLCTRCLVGTRETNIDYLLDSKLEEAVVGKSWVEHERSEPKTSRNHFDDESLGRFKVSSVSSDVSFNVAFRYLVTSEQ